MSNVAIPQEERQGSSSLFRIWRRRSTKKVEHNKNEESPLPHHGGQNDDTDTPKAIDPEGHNTEEDDERSEYTWVASPRWWLWWLIGGSMVLAILAIGVLCGVTGQCRRRERQSSVMKSNEHSIPPTPAPRHNDECRGAVGPLRIGGRSTVAYYGDAEMDFANPCNNNQVAQGLWYTVIGGGEVLRASTCPKLVGSQEQDNSTTAVTSLEERLPTKISIFRGDCESLQCVGFNSDFCGEQSSVSWLAEKGVQYHLFVEGDAFDLDLDYEYNGYCENSIGPIDDTTVVAGSLRGAGFVVFDSCDFEAPRGGQVWYWVKGTGDWMVASTCHPATDFGARVDVYGLRECVLGTCVSPRDSDCGNGYQMIWKSEVGIDYRVLVYKSSFIQGIHFELSVKSFTPVENDACDNAMPLELGTTVKGDTRLSTFDYDTPNCGNLFQPGTWYTVQGTGEPLLASTCHEDTNYSSQISIYTGSCGSTTLVCVYYGIQYCNEKASVYWEAELGVTYYIFVHGSRYGVFPNIGQYALTVDTFVTEPNDTCEKSILLEGTMGMTIGSTFASTISFEAPVCSTFFSQAPGIWYRVVGTGASLRASTCDPETDFDTLISVYHGACDTLQCVNTDDNSCGLQASVAWTALESETYYIYVHGRLQSSVGRFALYIEEYSPLVDNDFCSDSIEVAADGSLITGTTTGATFDNAGTCVAPNTGPGVFYKVKGTGRTLRASLCNEETSFNAALSVYEGNCTRLECVDGNSDAGGSCGLHPETTWRSSPDTMYYVLIHGYDSRFGDFGLVLDQPEPEVENDYCVNAIPVALSEEFIMGTTEGATMDASPSCSNIPQKGSGVWYSVIGNGKRFEASTCNTGEERTTFIDTVLSIYTGDCSNLTCTLADDNFCGFQSRLVWLTEPGVTYYILVHGPTEGIFGLVVKEFVPKTANDFCTAAQGPLWPSNSTYPGSTVQSSYDEAPTCGLVENTSVSPLLAGVFLSHACYSCLTFSLAYGSFLW